MHVLDVGIYGKALWWGHSGHIANVFGAVCVLVYMNHYHTYTMTLGYMLEKVPNSVRRFFSP